MNESDKVVSALRLAVACILDAAEAAGPQGAPSGVVYAALNAHGLTLPAYQQILDALIQSGKVTVSGHCIRLVKEA
jgi:hypothetical protein